MKHCGRLVGLFHEKERYCQDLLTMSLVLLLCTSRFPTHSCLLPGGHHHHFASGTTATHRLSFGYCHLFPLSAPIPQLGRRSPLDILMLLWLFLNCVIELLCGFPMVPVNDTYDQGNSWNTCSERKLACTPFPIDLCAMYVHRSFYSMTILNLHHIYTIHTMPTFP